MLRRRWADDAAGRPAVTYDLPATFVVFNNGRRGMVKLEQEQGGLPEFGTDLDNPDIAAVAAALGLEAVRVTDPEQVDSGFQQALASRRPARLNIVTNPTRSRSHPNRNLPKPGASPFPRAKKPSRVADSNYSEGPELRPRNSGPWPCQRQAGYIRVRLLSLSPRKSTW